MNYKKYFYNICDGFLSPLYNIIFGFPRYVISRESMAGMKGIEYWYLGKYYTSLWQYWGPTYLSLFCSRPPIDERNSFLYHGNRGNLSPFD